MKIALLGDMALYGKYSVKNKNVFNYFEKVSGILEAFDHVVANYETPFVRDQKRHGYKSAYISSDIENIKLLKYLGITIVNLANNHIFDYGREGLNLTKKVLQDNGIQYFGVENKEVLIEDQNSRLALNGYCCYSTHPMGLKDHHVNKLNFLEVRKKMLVNKEKGIQNIISVHAGQEHVNYPNYDHIKFARHLSENAPYVYYGHHPHVLQGMEEYRGSLMAYSLGNFCFDDVYSSHSKQPILLQTDNNKRSVILSLEYRNNRLDNHRRIPIFANRDEMEVHRSDILDHLDQYSAALTVGKDEYIQKRAELLINYLSERKKKRNVRWYLTRLNHRSLLRLVSIRANRKQYDMELKRYLDSLPNTEVNHL